MIISPTNVRWKEERMSRYNQAIKYVTKVDGEVLFGHSI
jgi:hypothetical protein